VRGRENTSRETVAEDIQFNQTPNIILSLARIVKGERKHQKKKHEGGGKKNSLDIIVATL
jgi:hypothetical protein